jgi:hypothetical protein
MQKQNVEKQKAQAAPSTTEPKVRGKKSTKTLLIIIIVAVVSFCFLSSAAATAGVIYWKNKQEKEEEQKEDDKDENDQDDEDDGDDQDDDGDEDDENDGDNQDDGDDEDDQDDGDDDGDASANPSLEDLFTAMDGLESYSMTIASDEITEFGTLYAEYEAPDKMRVLLDMAGMTYESIAIGDEVYTRQDDGPWTEMDLGYTDISEEFMDMLEDDAYTFTPSGEKDGYWYYKIEYEGSIGEMYVTKGTNYVAKIVATEEGTEHDVTIEFDDFNSDKINIEKPM